MIDGAASCSVRLVRIARNPAKITRRLAGTSLPPRIAYTQYNTSSAQTGKGLPIAVYDSLNATFTGATGAEWRDTIAPAPGAPASSTLQYDALGRPTAIAKMHRSGPANPYVQTQTSYYGPGSPNYGAASSVSEDSAGANRITQTLALDSMGRATLVQDPVGKRFATVYKPDGEVESVTRVDGVPKNIASYVYGTQGVENGQVLLVTDRLSGEWQSFAYGNNPSRPWEKGLPLSTTEGNTARDGGEYTVAYTYTRAGDRDTTTYLSPTGTRRWGYTDYVRVGSPESASRVYGTMVELDANLQATQNEFHYAYDHLGRMAGAAFAQTPSMVSHTPGESWYTSQYPALKRAQALYVYDTAGRMTTLLSQWRTASELFGNWTFNSVDKLKQEYTYDARGLKTTGKFYDVASPSGRTETYGYDNQRDFLSSVNYGDGSPSQAWKYDLGGNRSTEGQAGGVFDNLNRMISGGGKLYQNDLLGNRLWENRGQPSVKRYLYDDLNRATSICGAQDGAAYTYRADGMRVQKVSGLTIQISNAVDPVQPVYREQWLNTRATTRYFYDGQMNFEEGFRPTNDTVSSEPGPLASVSGGSPTVTRYGLGARGVDYVEKSVAEGSPSKAYPLYDGHGNMLVVMLATTLGAMEGDGG